MSMYTQLLEAGLKNFRLSDPHPSLGGALAELLRCRSRLLSRFGDSSGRVDVPETLSNELAYDIALIALAQGLGIDCEIRGFEQPQHERKNLENELVNRGVRLDHLGG